MQTLDQLTQNQTMKINAILVLCLVALLSVAANAQQRGSITLQSKNLKPGKALVIDGIFVETAKG